MRFREELAALLDERFYPLAWVEQRIADGSIATFENEGAMIGVEKRVYPGGAVELHGMFAVGDLDAIKELIGIACVAGANAGCTVAAIESRAGWERALRDMGFRRDRVRLARDLS